MHGAGNDYIYVDATGGKVFDMLYLAKKLSDRHFSIGGDGVVFICDSRTADVRMRMFNADGSEGKMCGNASRCIAKYVYEKGLVKKPVITLETLSGTKVLNLTVENDTVTQVTVDMSAPELEPNKIPCKDTVYNLNDMQFYCVSMGNPHAVTVVQDVYNYDIEKTATILQKDSFFPESVNVEFAQIIDRKNVIMRVYERGSGETLACGTGACATVVALAHQGLIDMGEVTVTLLGGVLKINYTGGNVLMTGGAEISFEGYVEV